MMLEPATILTLRPTSTKPILKPLIPKTSMLLAFQPQSSISKPILSPTITPTSFSTITDPNSPNTLAPMYTPTSKPILPPTFSPIVELMFSLTNAVTEPIGLPLDLVSSLTLKPISLQYLILLPCQ